jgi:hypothetical protein
VAARLYEATASEAMLLLVEQRLDWERVRSFAGAAPMLVAADGVIRTVMINTHHRPFGALTQWEGQPLRTVRGVTRAVRELTATSLPALASAADAGRPDRPPMSSVAAPPTPSADAAPAARRDPASVETRPVGEIFRTRLFSMSPTNT